MIQKESKLNVNSTKVRACNMVDAHCNNWHSLRHTSPMVGVPHYQLSKWLQALPHLQNDQDNAYLFCPGPEHAHLPFEKEVLAWMFLKEEEGEAVSTCTITNQFEDLSADFAEKSYGAK
jgi:hypothetical protein